MESLHAILSRVKGIKKAPWRSAVRPSGDLHRTAAFASNLRLLSHLQSILDLNPKVTNRVFQLCVAQQQLDSSQVLCAAIDQGCLGASHRMCAIRARIEPISDTC